MPFPHFNSWFNIILFLVKLDSNVCTTIIVTCVLLKLPIQESPNPLSSDEVRELQLALNQKAVNFRQELADARKSKSSEEVKKIMEAYQKEMEMAQQQLDREKERMQAGLMAKLEARKQRRGAAQVQNYFERNS